MHYSHTYSSVSYGILPVYFMNQQRSHDNSQDTEQDQPESLVQWRFTEEKQKKSKDKELLIAILGASIVILSALAGAYVFCLLMALATMTILYIRREHSRTMLFNITPVGLFMDNDFIEIKHIKAFNIIDDPGETARLILKVERVIYMNEIIPIFDVTIEKIEQVLTDLGIQKEEELEPTVIDHLTTVLL